MGKLRVLFWDHLSESISCLDDIDKQDDLILLFELKSMATHVPHHKKKLVFLFSAMRHFAKELKAKKYNVCYVSLDDKANTDSVAKEIERAARKYKVSEIVLTTPSDYYLLEEIEKCQKLLKIPFVLKEDNRFLCSKETFKLIAKGKKQLRMEFFYRSMRQEYSILMNGKDPLGGAWNFDAENRSSPPKQGLKVPIPYKPKSDAITKEVSVLVEKHFKNHFGDLEPFCFCVTRKDALKALQKFMDERLPNFGTYQDAMLEGEPWMFHSHISMYLNCALLHPLECVMLAEDAFKKKKASLNAVEGFIRQIIGWREFVRGVYWLKMPKYAEENFFKAKRDLPDFYWTGKTRMNCLKQCILETKQHAYAHHIQRLMVLGNFALLAGIDPKQVNEWFWIVYADAYEWVELPNVTGMALFADGGYLASKPYASGGSYINKMSNYCTSCEYSVAKKEGPDACPFNYLYWDFLRRNRETLSENPRIGMMYKTYDRMSKEKKETLQKDAKDFLKHVCNNN